MPAQTRVIVIGGGAAGFFGAIAAAESGAEVTLLEKGSHFLAKVRISGGGRCNVTHACFDPKALSLRYPRGGRALIGAFHRFQPQDTVEWFESRGVPLKTEADGRIFPVSDSSQSIIDCLTRAAEQSGVVLRTSAGVERIEPGFAVHLQNGETLACDRVLLAPGGSRAVGAGQLAASLGHTLEPPVPSLFTFEIAVPWLREIPGIAVEAGASIPGTKLRERGPVLITHWGLSGPAILRLSAWGARELAARAYQFPLHIDWLPGLNPGQISDLLKARRVEMPGRLVLTTPIAPLPARLWEKLAALAGVEPGITWNRLPYRPAAQLAALLHRTELPVTGKSLNKEEFVTCGGVRLPEVDFRTMESRVCPGLHLAGEILDLDGITGGFNFQAAWTTGWLAGRAMAGKRED